MLYLRRFYICFYIAYIIVSTFVCLCCLSMFASCSRRLLCMFASCLVVVLSDWYSSIYHFYSILIFDILICSLYLLSSCLVVVFSSALGLRWITDLICVYICMYVCMYVYVRTL